MLHWYVFQSKARKQDLLCEQLRLRELEVFFPTLHVKPVNPRARKIKPYFPGYVFARVDLHEYGRSILDWIPGVVGIVSFGGDPAAVLFDALQRANAQHTDCVIVDTAGRLHVKANLMAELDKIRRVIERGIPGAPHETLLVLDATVGQNGIRQAQEFDKALKLTAIALTKLDGTAKGGIVLAITDSLKIPIRWVGVGEGIEDLVPFDAGEYASALVRG